MDVEEDGDIELPGKKPGRPSILDVEKEEEMELPG